MAIMSGTRTAADADVAVVIAVKRLAAAKTRLASAFPPAGRESVVLATSRPRCGWQGSPWSPLTPPPPMLCGRSART
jgi:hypothetical protein